MFLKSAKDLVNEPRLEGELAIKGGIFTVVNQKKHSINNIHVWTSAFMIYASVMLEKFPNNGQEYNLGTICAGHLIGGNVLLVEIANTCINVQNVMGATL